MMKGGTDLAPKSGRGKRQKSCADWREAEQSMMHRAKGKGRMGGKGRADQRSSCPRQRSTPGSDI